MSTGKILLGVLAGVAVGTTLGILFAPDKGTKTRKKITRKREELVDQLVDKFNEFVEGVTEKFESMKDGVVHATEAAREEVEEVVDHVASKVK